MKKILFILISLFSISAFAQEQPIGPPEGTALIRGGLRVLNIPPGSINDSMLLADSTGRLRMMAITAIVGDTSTPPWQRTLDVSSVLNKNNTINANNFNFSFSNLLAGSLIAGASSSAQSAVTLNSLETRLLTTAFPTSGSEIHTTPTTVSVSSTATGVSSSTVLAKSDGQIHFASTDGVYVDSLHNTNTSLFLTTDINGRLTLAAPDAGSDPVRFGIEDITGVQDRLINLGVFGLEIVAGTPDFSGQTAEFTIGDEDVLLMVQSSPNASSQVDVMGGRVSVVSTNDGGTTSSIINASPDSLVLRGTDGITPAVLKLSPAGARLRYNGSIERYIPLTVNGNAANSAGNITISVGGSGTVTNFSAGDLSPLFTTSEATTTTTPALSFTLTNAAANTYYGNNTGSSVVPAFHNFLTDVRGAITLTTTGTSGAATYTGGVLNIPNYATGGGGSVSSVGLVAPASLFSVSGSPVTTSGNLTFSLITQTANKVLASPNGSTGVPTMRLLVANDIPSLTASKISNFVATARTSISLTTTGTSGAATYNNITGVLNIPNYATGGGGSGTVTIVSVVTANGVSGTVATATTTPAITLNLGAITPTSVAATGTMSGSNLSGTNTGDQTITLTGNVTGSGIGSFAATIANNAVTYAKFQQAGASTILGNPTASTANISEITIGSGLSLSVGGVLTATGGGSGTVTEVSGTTNRITVATGTTTPVINISSIFEALLGKIANPLSQFAATTSAELAGVISNETGSGLLVFATTPTLTAPVINVSSDATGDIYYRSSGGVFTRLSIGSAGEVLTVAGGLPSWVTPGTGGSVTNVSFVNANGISGSVANPTTTPAITLDLGAITPTSVAATGTMSGSNLSGTNTGDQNLDDVVAINGTTIRAVNVGPLTASDASSNLLFSAALVSGSPTIEMGDIDAIGNSTTIKVDDNISRYIFSKRGFDIGGIIWAFPAAQGGANTFLRNDGSGNLTWTSVPAQFNPIEGTGIDIAGTFPNQTFSVTGTASPEFFGYTAAQDYTIQFSNGNVQNVLYERGAGATGTVTLPLGNATNCKVYFSNVSSTAATSNIDMWNGASVTTTTLSIGMSILVFVAAENKWYITHQD